MEIISPARFSQFRNKVNLTQDHMGRKLGIGGKYVGMIERGTKEVDVDSSLGKLFCILENSPLYQQEASSGEAGLSESLEVYNTASGCRMVPVVSWAHAGEAVSYEELPDSWQEKVPTECKDEHAFALQLKGQSMIPVFLDEDILVLTPGEEPHNGCLVVARFKNDGVICRRVEFESDMVRLVPENDRYEAREYHRDEFSWIYPIWGRWTQIWK